jgi:NDP-hexose C3-ketoreductase / dTDP-4-oxo-2-deoxy-alpha-D-pentos-2-ene 2,3-reductase
MLSLSAVRWRCCSMTVRMVGSREYLANHRYNLEGYEKLCSDVGAEPASVALAWLLHQDVVTAPIIGPRTADQLRSSVQAVSLRLDDATLTRLD